MQRLLVFLATVLLAGDVLAQGIQIGAPIRTVVGSLPGAPENAAQTYVVTDGNAADDCTTGGGSTLVHCAWNGAAFVALGGGGGTSGRVGIWDADGDGSTYVTCTAKDAPFPQCKYNGQRLYPDLADDLNCIRYNGATCSGTQAALPDGYTIALDPGTTYVLFPCWDIGAWLADANTPGSPPADTAINDPRDDTRHDEITDGAINACPLDTEGSYLWQLHLGDFKGRLTGAGGDSRNLDTARLTGSHLMDRGTYIVDDRGLNDVGWFGGPDNGTPGARALNIGRRGNQSALTQDNVGMGTNPFTGGESCGWGSISTEFAAENAPGYFCVADTGAVSASNWLSTCTAGQGARAILQYAFLSGQSRVTYQEVTLADDPTQLVQGACGAGELEVHLGFEAATNGRPGAITEAASTKTGIPFGDYFESSGAYLTVPDPSYFEADAVVEGITLMPQDWWYEDGGDCDIEAAAGTSTSGTLAIADSATCAGATDCVTGADFAAAGFAQGDIVRLSGFSAAVNALYQVTSASATELGINTTALGAEAGSGDEAVQERVAWSFPIDETTLGDDDCDTASLFGFWGGGSLEFRDSVVRNWHAHAVNGQPVAQRARIDNVEWWYGRGSAIMDPGNYWAWSDVRVYDSVFKDQTNLSYGSGLRQDRLEIHNSFFTDLYRLGQVVDSVFLDTRIYNSTFDNAFDLGCNTQRNVIDHVRAYGRRINASSTFSSLIYLDCNNAAQPLRFNRVNDFYESPLGRFSGAIGSTEGQYLVSFGVPAGETGNVYANTLSGGMLQHDDVDACMFAIQAGASPGVLQNNLFLGNIALNGRMFCWDRTAGAGGIGLQSPADVAYIRGYGNLIGSGDGIREVHYGDNFTSEVCDLAITLETPGAAENATIGFTEDPLTITRIRAVIQGTTSVDFDVLHGTDRSAGTDVIGTDATANSSTAGVEVTSFADATVPPGSYIWIQTSAISGTPSELQVTICRER